MTIVNVEVEKKLHEIGQADVVIGIPSFNNAATIGHVVRAASAGLAKYFMDQRCVLINSDGGSSDGTPDAVLTAQMDYQTILVRHPVYPIHRIATPYHGIPGKGSAFRTIFQIAVNLKARACAVLDSDLRSITPEWVELLVRPVLSGDYDYVAPFYLRHKFDGTITNSIVYPVTRALYGKRIRQPIGGDFGFSGKLAEVYLSKDVWNSDVARFGIDIWMTTTAICEGFRLCEAFLGVKIHNPKDPGSDLSSMMMQVVGSLFDLMEVYPKYWSVVKSSQRIPRFGFEFEAATDPINVNVERMVTHFRHGLRDLESVWTQLIAADNMKWLRSLAAVPSERFDVPDELWVKIIYDLAVAYHKKKISPEHIVRSMTPLYMARVASFVGANRTSSALEVEARIEDLCSRFEELKDYLIERW